MNRFLNEDNGLQMAFLDGNQPDRVCEPMKVSRGAALGGGLSGGLGGSLMPRGEGRATAGYPAASVSSSVGPAVSFL